MPTAPGAVRTLLIRSGEAPDALFYVIAGSVEVLIEDEHGKELVLAYLGKDEFFGGMGLLDSTPGRGAYVRARGRILQALDELCEQPDALTHSEGMQICVSRQELAKLVGCSREMAGRVLRALEEQGTLRARGKTIVMLGLRPARLLGATAVAQPAAAAMAPRMAHTVAA